RPSRLLPVRGRNADAENHFLTGPIGSRNFVGRQSRGHGLRRNVTRARSPLVLVEGLSAGTYAQVECPPTRTRMPIGGALRGPNGAKGKPIRRPVRRNR